jgi:NadR type nicotinamide-nucleotide adenylyltransferase
MEKISESRTIKIVITGPESTGKSTLAKKLSVHFDAPWLPEYAREYLENLNRDYVQADLLEIALGQSLSEKKALKKRPALLLADTSFEVIKIWSEWKFNECHTHINKLLNEQSADLYLLLYPDVEWQHDPLREHPNQRLQLFQKYEQLLIENNCFFNVIKGTGINRFKNATKAILEYKKKLF